MSHRLDRRALVAGGAAAGLIAVTGLVAARGGLAATAETLSGPTRPAVPRRIVSLNPCLDVILAQVADRSQIAALSHYARDPYGSTIAPLARTLPFTYGTAEEVLALSPDLVIMARQTSAATRQALDRLKTPVAAFELPETVAASLAQVREVAALVGHPERGEALVGRIEAALRAAAPAPGTPQISALVFMPGGFASGPGTLMDEMMRRTGLVNAVTRYGLRRSMSVPLEYVIADPPQVLLAGEPYPGAPSWAERIMEHPALNHVVGGMKRATFPERLLFCGGPVLIQTAQALATARDQALAQHITGP